VGGSEALVGIIYCILDTDSTCIIELVDSSVVLVQSSILFFELGKSYNFHLVLVSITK